MNGIMISRYERERDGDLPPRVWLGRSRVRSGKRDGGSK